MNYFATWVRLLSLSIAALFFTSSCATTLGVPGGGGSGRAAKAPAEGPVSGTDIDKHPQEVRKAAVISILSDSAIIDETKDGSEIVDLSKNRRIAYETARHMVYILKEKGFDINGSLVSSVGAWMDDGTVYMTKTERPGASGNPTVGEAVPPLFVNHPFSEDASQKERLVNLHRNLIRGDQRYFTESGELGIAGDALLVIHLGGRTFYREFLQGQDESLTQGSSVFSLYMVDLKSGKIVWKETLVEKHLPPLKDTFFSLSDKALSHFPDRW